ncbi:MAG: hypothetical protein Rubg2KO_34190 [Rubricoccaceae bacterium]
MKLGNLKSGDPSSDTTGLASKNKLENALWEEFGDDPYQLHSVAEAIRSSEIVSETPARWDLDEEEEFVEGRILTRLHQQRERKSAASRRKKERVLSETGKLKCEACEFDFMAVYGDLGRGFAECHHTVPVSELREGQTTRLTDLSILCANCHRMVHRSRPMLSVEDLRALVSEKRPTSSAPSS